MGKQKLRSEISSKYKWDMQLVYSEDDDFYKDIEKLKEEILHYRDFKDNLFDNIDNFRKYLKLDENVEKLFNKIFTYSERKSDEDTTNTKYQKMVQEAMNLYSLYSMETAFILPLLYKTDSKIIDSYLEKDDLIKYKRYFNDLLKYNKYTLSEKEEELISNFNKALQMADNTYSLLTDADITFPEIIDEDGNKVELTESNFSRFIESKDRNVRKEAFNKLFTTYSKYKNTITSIYTGHIDSDIAITRLRKYNSTIERYLYKDDVDVSVYNTLIESVRSKKTIINNYFNLMQKELKLDELHRYDVYTPFVDEFEKKYPYEDAKKIVLDALSILGDDYIKKLNREFDSNLIDVYNNKGKRGGAYSAGTFDTPPYILLNYEDRLNDVSTLAHELGHSMHTYYSVENNERVDADYKIFVAEVASTTNELLLNNYLLKNSNDKKEKLYILNNLMKLYYATIVRQTMFAEFEKKVYELREQDKPLTHEILEDIYYNLCKDYFGESVYMDNEIRYEWERIPHFYYGFYVYKYATSLAASTVIVDNILSDKKYVSKYINFLKSGCKKQPLELLKDLDIDLENKDVVCKAMEKFNYYIDEFKKISNE